MSRTSADGGAFERDFVLTITGPDRPPIVHAVTGFLVQPGDLEKMVRQIRRLLDDPERARQFWEELLGTTLEPRRPGQGQGWQAVHSGVTVGVHERGSGPGDRFALPYFAVPVLSAALEQVRSLGGEVVHPGERWVISRDSEGTPFGLGGPAPV